MHGERARVLLTLGSLLWLGLASGTSNAQTYFPVAFSHNAQLATGFPTGAVTLGGVPFVIPESGLNYWNSESAGGPNPRALDIYTNRYGVTRVFTIINTFWGKTGGPFASLEFFGDNGAYHKKDLYGNTDIRDFNKSTWTNSINGTTTINVFDNATWRLDRQRIDLPAAFASQALVRIRLSDSGATDFQRAFLVGVTVESQFALAGALSHLASGGTWKTSIALLNPGSSAATATLQAFDDAGGALRLPWTFSAGAPETNSVVTRTVQPGGGLLAETVLPDDQATAVGWMKLHGTGSMTGFAVFRQKVGDREQEAVVPLETRDARSYILWFDNTSGYTTSVAICNEQSATALIVVTIRDDTGRTLQTIYLQLPAHGHTAFALPTRYSATAGIRGTIEFQRPTNGLISILGLRFNPSGAFTTLPAVTR